MRIFCLFVLIHLCIVERDWFRRVFSGFANISCDSGGIKACISYRDAASDFNLMVRRWEDLHAFNVSIGSFKKLSIDLSRMI